MNEEAEVTLRYDPLPPIEEVGRTPPYTRVLTLFPGTASTPLFCTLELLEIENPRYPYEALSYVWGTETSPDPLFCSDGFLTITSNLAQALRYLRYVNRPRRLWIDAVCINQRDLNERARQVEYMRLVYKHAICVVIWLGLKDRTVETAFRFARELGELLQDLALNAHSENIRNGQAAAQNQAAQQENIQLIMHQAFNARGEEADALTQLLSRNYFERVWCIQETVASSNCVCKSEDLELDLTLLLSLVSLVIERRGVDPTPSPLQLWHMIANRKLETQQASNRLTPQNSLGRILLLLKIIRNFRSTDPRDRIFALLGISDEGLEPILGLTDILGSPNSRYSGIIQRGAAWLTKTVNSLGPGLDIGRHPALTPNYTKSKRDTYRDFARYCMRRSPRVLDVLSHVQHYADPNDDFPTWVPKFDEPRIASFFITEPYLAGIPAQGHYPYFAEVHDNPLRPDNPYGRSIQQPNLLQLDGYRVDEVEAVSKVVTLNNSGEFSPEEVWSQLYNMPLFPRSHDSNLYSNEALDVAFLMTLTCGGVPMLATALLSNPETVDKNRGRALDQAARLGKADILEWLRDRLKVDDAQYGDLVQDSRGAIRSGSVAIYRRYAASFCVNRRVYRTKTGILGLGPKIMRPGDSVVVLFGGHYPFVLRRRNADWIFIGETYIRHQAIMTGEEVMTVRSHRGKHRVETFKLR